MDTTSPHPQIPSDELTRGLGRIILSEADIQGRVTELAAQISEDYAGRNPLLIGVLRGVVFFMSDLLPRHHDSGPAGFHRDFTL